MANFLMEDLEEEIRNEAALFTTSHEKLDESEAYNMSEERPNAIEDQELYLNEELKKIQHVTQIAKLLKSQRLNDIMVKIDQYSQQNELSMYGGSIEQHPEYQLILQANDVFMDIENEIMIIYRFIKQHYGKRFAELEKIVPNILDYVKVVKAIGNEVDMAKVNLSEIVANTTVMVITMTASTSVELKLPMDELDRVLNACDMILELEEIRKKLLSYIEGRMTFMAPNLVSLLGSNVATKLIGLAGGIHGLAKIPACNVLVMGKLQKTLSGFSIAHVGMHTGCIYQCNLVTETPPDYRSKAARLLSAKCALAARVDSVHDASDGSIGLKFRKEIEERLDKLQEISPARLIKPLPVPIEQPKKRRGGKRVRKMKERYVVTELRKQTNRMAFGLAEEQAEFMGKTKGLGMIGADTGRVRAAVADARNRGKNSELLVGKKHEKENE